MHHDELISFRLPKSMIQEIESAQQELDGLSHFSGTRSAMLRKLIEFGLQSPNFKHERNRLKLERRRK